MAGKRIKLEDLKKEKERLEAAIDCYLATKLFELADIARDNLKAVEDLIKELEEN